MIETLIRNWWLLFLRGALACILAVMTFLILPSVDTFTLRPFALRGIVVLLGILTVAAGLCTLAAGVWRAGSGKSWWLGLEGTIVASAGAVMIESNLLTVRFLVCAIVVLAAGIGTLELAAS